MDLRGNIILLILEYFAVLALCETNVKDPRRIDKKVRTCHLHGTLTLGVTFNDTEAAESQSELTSQHTYRLPDDVTFHGSCTPSFMDVRISPLDATFTLSLVFQTKVAPNHQKTWAVTNISMILTGNNSDIHYPHNVQKRDRQLRKDETMLFETPANKSYTCTSRQYIYLGPERDRATVVFSQVRLQPFSELKSHSQNGYICADDYTPPAHAKHAGIIIPVILAVSLAIVLLLLLIGYIIHKKIEGMGYINMD